MKFISHPHYAMLTPGSSEQLQTLPMCRVFGQSTYILEDGGHTGQAVDAGIDN